MHTRDSDLTTALRTLTERLARAPEHDEAHRLIAAVEQRLAEQAHRLTEQAHRIVELERQASRDELTGLLNRRGFTAELEQVLAAARRYDEQGVLIYIDLDGFKPINDSYGHAAGDEVLRQVGHLLADNIRDSDHAARLGGDEFAVILTRTGWDDGLRRAERLERQLNSAYVAWDGRMIALKASLGVRVFDGETDSAALLHHADGAMYRAKRRRHSAASRAAA